MSAFATTRWCLIVGVGLGATAFGQDAGAVLDAGTEAELERLAVIDTTVSGSATPALARALADVAATEASRVGGARVITQVEVAAMLGAERQRQLLGCSDDTGCVSDIANALQMDRILSSEVTVIEHTTLLVVRHIDTHKARVLARVNVSLKDASEATVLDAMRRLTHEALTGQKLDTSGALRITVEESGARVTLDGKDLGLAPLAEPTQRVLEGPHELLVQKDGFVRWSSTVTATAGVDSPVTVKLVPVAALTEGYRSRAWSFGYSSAGVAVAGGATGLVAGVLSQLSYNDYLKAHGRQEALDLHDKVNNQALVANVALGVAAVAAAASVALFVTAVISEARAKPHAATADPVLPSTSQVRVQQVHE